MNKYIKICSKVHKIHKVSAQKDDNFRVPDGGITNSPEFHAAQLSAA